LIKGGWVARVVDRVPRGIRKKAWRTAVRGRRLMTAPTAPLRALPDYLIVGGQRCGTTSLQKYLIQHPAVVAPGVLKGIHYFDMNFAEGETWYRSQFPMRITRAWHGRGGTATLTGEASPYYMFHPLGAERIAATVPAAKLIALVRHPVDRAYSHYLHEVRRGFEDRSFEEAIALEPERLAGEEARIRQDPSYVSFAHQHHSYAARGMYADQLEHLAKHVPREQILVVSSEEMFADAAASYGRVLEFLGLEPFTPADFATQNANVYREPIPDAARARLAAVFAEPNRRLEAFVGRSFGWDG
jgi:hypothetical protein